MQTVLLTDALDAMESNLKAFVLLTGRQVGFINAVADSYNGTASIDTTASHGRIVCATVRFPALPGATRLTRAELDRWTAYFLHEICHAFYTKDNDWRQGVYEGLAALVNGLEDPRIERKAMKDAFASNFRELLTGLMAWVLAKALADKNFDPNDLRQLPFILAVAGRVVVCKYDLPAGRVMLDSLNPWTQALVAEAMRRLARASSTGAVVDIARWIKGECDTLKRPPVTERGERGERGETSDKAEAEAEGAEAEGAEAEGAEAEGAEAEGDKAEGDKAEGAEAEGDKIEGDKAEGDKAEGAEAEGDKAEGDKAEGDKAEGAEAEGAEAEGAEAEGDKAEGESTVKGAEGEGDAGRGGDGPKAPKGGEAEIVDSRPAPVDTFKSVDMNPVSDKVKAESLDHVGDGQDAAAEVSIIEAIRDAQRQAGKALKGQERNGSPWMAQSLKAEAVRCGKLRAQMAKVLKAEETEAWQHGRSAGRLDRFALGRIAAGQVENVYAKRTVFGGYETEIAVLVDLSGSMATGGKARAASVLALVVAQAAQQVGVRCEVLSFNSRHGLREAKAVNGMIGDASAFVAMAGGAGGGTPLTGSMVKAAARLAARAPAKRKLMFVISDGADDYGIAGVRKAAAYARRLDIETVGLCIDARNAQQGFDMIAHCDSAHVAEAGLGALVSVLSRYG